MPSILIKRGARAQIDAAAVANDLAAGEPYLVTDEGRLAVGTAANAYSTAALRGEGQVFPWVRRIDAPRIAGDIAGATLTTLALDRSRLYYVPFSVPRSVTLTGLRISVTTAAAGQANLGIYGTAIVSGSEAPGNLIAAIDATLDTGATGERFGLFASYLTLHPGRIYWAALICSAAAATVRALAVGNIAPAIGRQVNNTGIISHLFAAGSGATLPATAPAVSNGVGSIPAIYLVEV